MNPSGSLGGISHLKFGMFVESVAGFHEGNRRKGTNRGPRVNE